MADYTKLAAAKSWCFGFDGQKELMKENDNANPRKNPKKWKQKKVHCFLRFLGFNILKELKQKKKGSCCYA